jgi:hypothetical protein
MGGGIYGYLTLSNPAQHPVHNVERMLTLWVLLGSQCGKKFMTDWGIAIRPQHVASGPELTPDSRARPSATLVALRKTRTSDSPDSIKRHEPSGRSGGELMGQN